MKLVYLSTFICQIAWIYSNGQSLSIHNISAGGDQMRLSNGIEVSWTLGESVVSSSNSEFISNLGFQQGALLITSVDQTESERAIPMWRVFPNPSNSYFIIAKDNSLIVNENWQYKLIDTSGRIVFSGMMDAHNPTHQSVEQLAAGLYTLLLYNTSGNQQTFKLQHLSF